MNQFPNFKANIDPLAGAELAQAPVSLSLMGFSSEEEPRQRLLMGLPPLVVRGMGTRVRPQLSAVEFRAVLAGEVSLQLFLHPLSQ